jgi:hypothetical protein
MRLRLSATWPRRCAPRTGAGLIPSSMWLVGMLVAATSIGTFAQAPKGVPDDPLSACRNVSGAERVHVYVAGATGGWKDYAAGSDTPRPVTLGNPEALPRNNRGVNGDPIWSTRFPGVPQQASSSRTRGFPAAESPDRRLFAAALYDGDIARGSTRTVSITDLPVGSMRVFSVPLSVEALAWAPDSQRLALIEVADDATIRDAGGAAARLFGWKKVYRDYWLGIYTVEGAPLCRMRILKRVINTSVRIVWE